MNLLSFAIIAFIFLELLNVSLLYFSPGSSLGNGMGVFSAWEKSKADPDIHAMVRYLVTWVAGTKLIFIGLLIVIIAVGDWRTQQYAVGVLILSISIFFWRLFPMIRRMDQQNQISPKGYSNTLGVMIGGFVLAFAGVLIFAILNQEMLLP